MSDRAEADRSDCAHDNHAVIDGCDDCLDENLWHIECRSCCEEICALET